MATRYNSYDSRSSTTSSHFSDPSSSAELNPCSFKHKSSSSSSRAIVKSKPSDLSRAKSGKVQNHGNFTTMVKKFMEMKSSSSSSSKKVGLVIPCEAIAEDLKKPARGKGGNLGALQKKLFGKGSAEKEKKEVKALMEVKGNTRTLAMVLRSERELLSLTKEQEMEIADLKLLLEEKNKEVEKLKDLCLKQREEIKSLKSAILFPDVMNSQLHDLLDKQGSELKHARQVIPTLQRQVTSLTGQLQCLAEDLAEVKADKYSTIACYQRHSSSPRTPTYDDEDATNSLEYSSSDPTTPGSPDDMFLKDLNPCLTPGYSKTKCKDLEAMDYDSPNENLYENNMKLTDKSAFNSCTKKLSKSSDCYQSSKRGNTIVRAARRSDESKALLGKQMHHKFL